MLIKCRLYRVIDMCLNQYCLLPERVSKDIIKRHEKRKKFSLKNYFSQQPFSRKTKEVKRIC